MPFRCHTCNSEASQVVKLVCCSACRSALYCSKACQKIDWKKEHKLICKSLNVGRGSMQVKHHVHIKASVDIDEVFEEAPCNLNTDGQKFFQLFFDSTQEGSQAVAKEMEQIVNRQILGTKFLWLVLTTRILIRGDTDKLTWPNSPLRVLLRYGVNPNVHYFCMDPGIQVDSTSGPTALHYLACMSHTDDIVTHEHQVILARQLIENGADVKAVSDLDYTPLHYACMSGTVTNLEFIQLLLENGADPNALTTSGKTPLLLTSHLAPAAAKFLIEWPGMNINHVAHSTGVSSLALVCMGIEFFSNTLENAAAHVSLSIGASVTATLVRPNFHRHAEYRFLLQQWREIKDTLEDMGAIDSGVRRLEY